ncbi:MAG: FtsW/RodA/SpoVE family cell cycle protein, partial [Firmicutes bacterium]|nr:FtsW/RodA/SpoVE family cell cycle protein [Bacillota bacterium]
MKKLLELNKNKPDYWLFGAVVMLVAFGCLMVYSASYYDAVVNHGDKWLFARRQILSAVIGLVAMCAISFIDFNKLKKLWLAA